MDKNVTKTSGKTKIGYTAGAILSLIVMAALSAPLWVWHSPIQIEPVNRLLPPSSDFWFGTDHFGRDILGRVVYGARISLVIGLLVTVLATVLGTITGLLAGYYRMADNVLMRLVDGVMAFPPVLLAIALVAALGGNMFNILMSLVLAFWPVMTRVARSATMQICRMQYIEAAKAIGTSDFVILFRHILPNILTPIIVQSTFIFAEAILAEAGLSFLGLGIKPPTPTWGGMLEESRMYLSSAPWFSIFPGIAIMLTVLSLNIFGDMLRDKLNPRAMTSQKRSLAESVKAVFSKAKPENSTNEGAY